MKITTHIVAGLFGLIFLAGGLFFFFGKMPEPPPMGPAAVKPRSTTSSHTMTCGKLSKRNHTGEFWVMSSV